MQGLRYLTGMNILMSTWLLLKCTSIESKVDSLVYTYKLDKNLLKFTKEL